MQNSWITPDMHAELASRFDRLVARRRTARTRRPALPR